MRVFTTVKDLQKFIRKQKRLGNKIGFVPTMGSLHEGHMSLIKASKKSSDTTVCSIFVNPTQFNQKEDLDNYPVTIEADTTMLMSNGCDVLFLPSVKEVYPGGTKAAIKVNLDGMDKVMEGAFRPGHFDGVVQVVNRLLDIVLPNYIFMGQKDFQQFSIIQKMIDELDLKTKLKVVSIKREKSGLAMSSRNARLSKKEVEKAKIIYKTIYYARIKIKKGNDINEVKKYALERLTESGFKPEYVSVVNTKTLKDVSVFKRGDSTVICIAAWLGDVRLIDNIII